MPLPLVVAAALLAFFLYVAFLVLLVRNTFVRAAADEALVRTGMGGSKVVIGGGILVLPTLHEQLRVSLRVLSLGLEVPGLLTADGASGQAALHLQLRVPPREEAVLAAARCYGANLEGEARRLLAAQASAGLRKLVAGRKLARSKRSTELARALQEQLTEELRPSGVEVELVSVESLSLASKEPQVSQEVCDLPLDFNQRPGEETCPYCRAALGLERVDCEVCGTGLHLACAEEHGACTTAGCARAVVA